MKIDVKIEFICTDKQSSVEFLPRPIIPIRLELRLPLNKLSLLRILLRIIPKRLSSSRLLSLLQSLVGLEVLNSLLNISLGLLTNISLLGLAQGIASRTEGAFSGKGS